MLVKNNGHLAAYQRKHWVGNRWNNEIPTAFLASRVRFG